MMVLEWVEGAEGPLWSVYVVNEWDVMTTEGGRNRSGPVLLCILAAISADMNAVIDRWTVIAIPLVPPPLTTL